MKHRLILFTIICTFLILAAPASSISADGEPCDEDTNCTSGHCESDYISANGKFCAKDSTSCVHKKTGDTTATQYDDGDENGEYKCDSGEWKVKDDYSCSANSDCDSDYCRSDYISANGKFCAKDSTSCVHKKTGDTTATQYDDGDTHASQKCSSGTWNFQDADSDGVGDDDDLCAGTSGGCTVGNGKVNATNGCPYVPYTFFTNLIDYSNETCVLGSLGAIAEPHCGAPATTLITYNLGGIPKSICNTTGDLFWPWPPDESKHMCPLEDLGTPGVGTFALFAEYDYGIPQSIYIGDITINNACNPNQRCSHAWRIVGGASALTISPSFSMNFVMDGSSYVTCKDCNVWIENINTFTTQCSDGVQRSGRPGIVGWIYRDGGYEWISINSGYATLYDHCIERTLRTSNLVGPASSTAGHIPTSDCAHLKISGTTTQTDKTNSYTLDPAGNYKIVIDMAKAYCDSPSNYICPWLDGSGRATLCNVGTMSSWVAANGWDRYGEYDITIIDPSTDLTANPATDTYYVSDPYNPSAKKIHPWSIKNDGVGKLNISNIAVTCPLGLACASSPTTDMIVDDGGAELIINTNFTLPCEYGISNYPITLEFNITDYYGLECFPAHTETITTTIIQGNISDDSQPACKCYTGKNNLWDGAGMHCCDPGDCWLAGDKSWLCDNGNRLEETVHCEEIHACQKIWYWNISSWTDKLPDGCGCTQSSDCDSGKCIAGVCLVPVNPNISFSSTSTTAELGSKTQAIITIKNNMAVGDTIKLTLYGTPEKILFWTKFTNNNQEIDISLNAYEEKLVPVSIFAGEIGTYKLTISGISTLVQSLYANDEQTIQIVKKDQGVTSRTPGLNAVSIFLLLLTAAMISAKKNH